MRDVRDLKNAMEREVSMLQAMDEVISNNKDVLTEEEYEIVTAYIESVRTPWSLVLKAAKAVIKKQEAEAAKDKEDKPKMEGKSKAGKSKKKDSEQEKAKVTKPVEEVEVEDEDWDFLGEED